MRILLTAVGVAIGAWCLFAALALPSVLNARQGRAAARVPVGAEGPQAKGDIGIVEDRIGSRTLTTVFVRAESPDTPLPPGLRSYPPTDQAIVSPALKQALISEPKVRPFFKFKVVGLIEDAGLIGPEELFAYVGGGPSAAFAGSFADFGRAFSAPIDIRPGDLSIVQRSLVVLLGVPLAAFFAVAARLAAASRDRRLAALRLLGMTARDTQRVNAVETVVASLLGVAAGIPLYAATHGNLSQVGVGGLVWFAKDSAPTLGSIVFALITIPTFAAAMAVIGSRSAARNALTIRRHGSTKPARASRLLPLGVGIAFLLGLNVTSSFGPRGVSLGAVGVFLLLGSVLLCAVGLALGFAPLVAITSKRLAETSPRLPLSLAMRRLEFDPFSPTRVVVGIVIVIFGMGFASGLQRDAIAATSSLGDVERYTLEAYSVPPPARSAIARIPGVSAFTVVASTTVEPRPGVPSQLNLPILVMFGSCEHVQRLAEAPLPCREGTGYRVMSPSSQLRHKQLVAGATLMIPLDRRPGSRVARVQVPHSAIKVNESNLIGLKIDLILPLDELPNKFVPDTAQFWFGSKKDARVIESISSSVATLAPDADLYFPEDDYKLRGQILKYQGLLRTGFILGVIVALLAFVVGSLDRAVERRANIVALSMVGVPIGTLRTAQAIQVAFPLLLGGALASTAGFLLEQATVLGGGLDRSVAWRTPVLAIAATVVAAILASGISSLAVSSRTDASLIRRE